MQTLGRVAIIGGSMIVAAANVYLFSGVEVMSATEKTAVYVTVYHWALLIPLISVGGVMLSAWLRSQEWRLAAMGYEFPDIERLLARPVTELPDQLVAIGRRAWVYLVCGDHGPGQCAQRRGDRLCRVFVHRVVPDVELRFQELGIRERNQLFCTAFVIFAFRAVPTTGAGETWWMIDVLRFDQQFLSQLSLITSALTLFGMFLFRRFMAERPITYIVAVLTVADRALPAIRPLYGLHEWTAARTGGMMDARFIALVDSALESPLGQIAMIPMLAWIANSAPQRLKATYFAVMAAFTNLALSLSQLLTKALNQWFLITREVKDASGAVTVSADYSELGGLLITVMLLGLALPMLAIFIAKRTFSYD